MSSVALPPIGVPAKRTSPELRTSPQIARSVVVFPAPFAPSSAVMVPSPTLKANWCNTSVEP